MATRLNELGTNTVKFVVYLELVRLIETPTHQGDAGRADTPAVPHAFEGVPHNMEVIERDMDTCKYKCRNANRDRPPCVTDGSWSFSYGIFAIHFSTGPQP